MTLKAVWSDFITFLKKPNLRTVDLTWVDKTKFTLALWGVSLVFIVLLGSLIELIVEIPEPDMFDIALEKLGIPAFIAFVVLVGPLFEEIVFRSPLRFRVSSLIISSLFLVLFIIGLLDSITGVLGYILLGVVAALFFIGVHFLTKKKEQSEQLYTRYYPYIFYGISLLFGYIHITNFEDISTRILLLSPLVIFPQFVLGLGIGYVRVRYGFWYGCLFHVVNNAIAISMFFLEDKFL
ncbi:CPBP family glutamic-type intramembrane protease [Myroides pelagicus]|uniref:CPBP family intramembrane metalloprotease n=1 Tax=Myroides pelagicus TaxID=270914 RepID=A0A7K1GM52_9FLAO|nr:CPBP family glutamic-type intramembrane protease [Myroides pelagicus]MEC4113130.1 CPBP family glutamic-type intramembrane protease [Myroides pelagicus]MTH29820.1 CPBP family intramembrane metalloprotease [Myroides pelagicus]